MTIDRNDNKTLDLWPWFIRVQYRDEAAPQVAFVPQDWQGAPVAYARSAYLGRYVLFLAVCREGLPDEVLVDGRHQAGAEK